MIKFDVTRNWTILVPDGLTAAPLISADLARILGLLRSQAGSRLEEPPRRNADAPIDSDVPIIVLNGERKPSANGFSWRFGIDRVEIYGASERGLCNGVYDFLAALGIGWPKPDQEILPKPYPDHPLEYPLKTASGYQGTVQDPGKLRRLVITGKTPPKKWEECLIWAVRNRLDAVVLPLAEKPPFFARTTGTYRRRRESLLNLARQYALSVEIGGRDLSLLVPRRYFFIKNEMFRMEGGTRLPDHHFCPTNPDTIALLMAEARRHFGIYPKTAIFHLWPDAGAEQSWCSCPTCRAFSREEQNRIAVNAAADVLAEISPEARLSYYEEAEDTGDANPSEVSIRPNMFKLSVLPEDPAPEE
jgi:hypothetical protein